MSKEKPNLDAELIRHMHHKERKYLQDIAAFYGCDRVTVSNFMKEHGIPVLILNQKIGTSPENIELIKKMHIQDCMAVTEIAEYFGCGQGSMWRYFIRHNIPMRSCKEAKAVSKKTGVSLSRWREDHDTWSKGLTLKDPKFKALVEKGRATQIKNGKSKGKNNPMYGKLTHRKAGFRKDLGHYVRSSWEASFARILNFLNLEYDYEEHTFELSTGGTYTPDFYVTSKKRYYEIKGYEYDKKYIQFAEDYPYLKLSVINEKFYNRLVRRFKDNIAIDDKETFYTKEDLMTKFAEYSEKVDEKPSISGFCDYMGLSFY